MTRKKRKRPTKLRPGWRRFGTDIVITYKGGIDLSKDRAIRKALGEFSDGSGFLCVTNTRDHTATIPDRDFTRVVRKLKKIRGITTKKHVHKWVRV